MTDFSYPLFLNDAEGRRVAVQIPYDLWKRLEAQDALLAVAAPAPQPFLAAEPLAAFDDFLQYWDFNYPYSPAVRCPHCGTAVNDWRKGDERPFRLNNANFGGLLVFRCRNCDSTIRQKHFRDHVALEFTPPPRS